MPMISNVVQFPKRERPNAKERYWDEVELAQMAAKHEEREANKPQPFVSPYLQKRLRSEQEVRATRGKCHSVFETILSVWRP